MLELAYLSGCYSLPVVMDTCHSGCYSLPACRNGCYSFPVAVDAIACVLLFDKVARLFLIHYVGTLSG